MEKILTALLFTLTALTACSSHKPLNLNQPTRPLVFIPGLLASSLVDKKTGEDIWGGDRTLFQTPKERLQIPLSEFYSSDPNITAGKPINTLKVIPWIYSSDIYQELLEGLKLKGKYEIGKTLLFFPYDWRLAVPTNAAKLQIYLNQLASQHPNGIDVLADSMGGLILLEALRATPSSAKVHHLYMTGTPYFGSPNTHRMWQMPKSKVWFRVSKFFPQSLTLTIPALYYLLPRTKLQRKIDPSDSSESEFAYKFDEESDLPEAKPELLSDYVSPEFSQLQPDHVQEGLKAHQAHAVKWHDLAKVPRFSMVKSAYVFGSGCKKTFGLPGDSLVLAESIEATARVLQTHPTWLCAFHAEIPNSDVVLQTIVMNSQN